MRQRLQMTLVLLGILLPVSAFALNSLSIDLRTFPSQPVSGQTLMYQVEWRAGTGTPCTGDLVLSLPASGVTFESSNPGGFYDSGNHRVVWSGVRFHNGSGSRWARVTVNPGATSLTANAVITGGCSASTGSVTQPVDPGAVPILELTKTASKSTAGAGEQIIYTLAYANTGTGPATGVVLTDDLPDQVDWVSASNQGSESGGTVIWNLGSLAAGARGSVTTTVTVANPIADGTVLQNHAGIVSSELPTPLEVGPIEATATSKPVLTIVKATSRTHVNAGQQYSYTITYGNSGTDTATGVVVQDTLPPGVTFISASAGGTENNGVVTWNLPDLPAGRANQLLLTVQAPSPAANGTVLSNDATVDSNETAPVAAPTFDVTVDSRPVLVLKKDVSKTTANAGDTLTWTLTYSNTGSDQATNVQLQDVLPVGTSYSSSTNQGIPTGQQVDWNLGTLAAGASGSVIVSAVIDSPIADGTVLHNTASLQSAEFTQPATASRNTTVSSAPLLAIDKTVSKKLARAGESIVYTINYSNRGTDTATNVMVEDHLPGELSVTSVSGNGSESGGIVTWNKGTLAAGASGSVTVTATIDSPIANGTILHNSATIDSTETAPVAAAVEPADVFVISEARLTIDLKVSKAQASPGETLVYQVTYGNSGTDGADVAQVTLGLPPNVTLSSASAGAIPSGNALVWNVGLIGAGAKGTVSATVTIDTPLANGTRLDATAHVSDVLNHFATDTEETVISSAPRLELTKTASKSVAKPGETLVYTVGYSNNGTDAATNVVLEDILDPNLTFLSASSQGVESGGKVDWDLGTVAAGAHGSVTVTALVNSPLANGSVLHNHATIDSTETAPVSVGPVDVKVSSEPRLTISKKPSKTTARPGDSITYTIHFTNTGTDDATGVVVEDHLPPDLSFAQASNQGVHNSGVVDWTIGTLAAGSSGSVTVTATVNSPLANGTVLHNSASIDSAETTPVSTGNVDIDVSSKPVLSLLKKPSVGTVKPSNTLVYTLTFSNSGTDEATGVVLEDHLPPDVTFVSASNQGSHSNGVVTWDIGTLAAGANGSVTVMVSVNSPLPNGTILHNSASLHSNEVQNVTPPVTDVTVSSAPVLAISKKPSKTVASPGDTLIYTIEFNNTGSDQATNVLLEDHLPPEVTLVSASNNGVESGGVVDWSLGTLAAGASGSVSVTVSVKSPLANGTVLHNTATIDSAETAPLSAPSVDVTVTSSPVLVIQKFASASRISAGGQLVYTIDYHNTGSDKATGVVIEDQLPPHVSFVSATAGGSHANGAVLWSAPDVPAGSGGSVSVTVAVDSPLANGTILHNNANVDSAETPPVGFPFDVTVTSAPILQLAAAASRSTVVAGGQYALTLQYANTGNENASAVEVHAILPPEANFVSATNGGSFSAGIVSWLIPSLPAGSSGSVSVTLAASSPLPNGLVLPHASNISATGVPPLAAPLVPVTILSTPAFQLTKTPSAYIVGAGSQVTFDIAYFNNGSDQATGVVVQDVIPVNTSFVSASTGGAESGGAVSWNIGTVPAQSGATVSVTLAVDSPLADGTQIGNQAEITSNEAPPLAAPATITVSSAPQLSIRKTSQPISAVEAGGQVNYSLAVSNSGSDAAHGVTVVDYLPSGATAVQAGQGGQYDANAQTITWGITNLAAGASLDLDYMLTVPVGTASGSSWTNTAGAQAQNAAPVSTGASLTVSSKPILELSKTGGNSVEGGQNVTYMVEYKNSGNATAQNTVIEDTIPGGLIFVSASSPGVESGGTVTWSLGDIPPGGNGSVTLTLQAPAGPTDGTIYVNTASIGAANAPGATDSVRTVERTHVELDVSISALPANVPAGNPVDWTVSYANTGNSDAQNPVLSATLPPNTTFVSATDGGVLAGNEIQWNLGSLPALASGTVAFRVQVNSPLPNGTAASSTATVDADNGLPDSATGSITVSSAPLIVFAKASDVDEASFGAVIDYVITAQNLGNATATGVVITDSMPPELKILSVNPGGIVDTGSNSVTWNLGDLPAGGAPVALSVQAELVRYAPSITNVATIRTDQSPDFGASWTVSVGTPPALGIPTLNPAALTLLVTLLAMIGLRFVAVRRRVINSPEGLSGNPTAD